jgi:toluene monooxygenase system ferredoxin subunit
MAFETACTSDEIWTGEMLARRVAGRPVLLARVGGVVLAYEDRCPHLGVALSGGRLSGSTLTCAAHLWEYDLASGRGINPASACLRRFPVRIEDGRVFVDVEGA